MRGTVKGIIDDSNTILVQFKDKQNFNRDSIVEVKDLSEKKSNNANRYYWELNRQLSTARNLTSDEVYKNHIRELEIKQVFTLGTDEVERFEKAWTSGHLGRFVETRESNEPGQTIVIAWFGSSDFNKKEMSRLIDNCVQDCKALGIETDSPEKINRLIEMWEG